MATAETNPAPTLTFKAEEMQVEIYDTLANLGEAAAANTARIINAALTQRGASRVIFATGNSQFAFVQALARRNDIDWSRVTAFHMDEYVGMAPDHPASFRRWIHERIETPLQPKVVHYLAGDAPDLAAEIARYEGQLKEAPIDLVCMGIGENGHIAFNDPPVANFADPAWVKVVELDAACRAQQVGEGHFASLTEVPTHALSLTIPALLAPDAIQVVAPEARKAQAVKAALTGPISETCPASILRTQAQATLYLDPASATFLERT